MMEFKKEHTTWIAGRTLFIVSIVSLLGARTSSYSSNPPISTPIPDTLTASVPDFDHIVIITFENRDYNRVIGNILMPDYNWYAWKYTRLTQFYAVTHPSLPNYLAMIGGDTFNISTDCYHCFVDAKSLPDLIEASGRTWRTYQEDMQTPCGLGSQDKSDYLQKHNPFVYFDPIRLDQKRCQQHVVSLNDLQSDIRAGTLPNFIFITPDMCHIAHDCHLYNADICLGKLMKSLLPALERKSSNYLVVLNWDEGQGNSSCCGLPQQAGGRIPVVLISPRVKSHYQDATPYTHYSLLKTISKAWGLPYLGHAADRNEPLILAPWN
jgi:phosphatidylinositol-3-phosphatase